MESTKHLHDQIARATTRLAQLKARDLITRQRQETRDREAAQKRGAMRRQQLGQLVFAAGCDDLPDGEIVSALLNYLEGHRNSEVRTRARLAGDAHLAALAAGCSPRKH